jgi:hypothetical protein
MPDIEGTVSSPSKWDKLDPWIKTWRYIKQRAGGHGGKPKDLKHYGHVKVLLSPQDLRFLWFRDGAKFMKCPSIDRIDSNGHYELSNCRYIEHEDNANRSRDDQKIPVIQCSISGDPIREFDSIHDAVTILGLRKSGISKAIHGKLKTYHGHTWRLKSALQNERN